ncbi:hypothetical protein [Klebsiella pneumoniae]|uniref:hypothetical protein n=1 Tax=Klebsiella pneumoniae TaxID=573 RepID=UPI00273873A3|nr:hypothetical protein [Klebsiella pneumoniae]
MKKQWDKILASARRQILAQVSAFPALMGIKKSMRQNKIKCPVSSLEKKRCALFFDSVIQTANNKSYVPRYGNKNEIHYQDDNNQYRRKIK